MIWFSISLLLLGRYGARILYRHLHEAKLIRLREMVHVERMAALERNLSLPESTVQEIESALSSGSHSPVIQVGSDSSALRWIRFASLAFGLIGLFGGIGTAVGLYLVPDHDVQGTWPLGSIPVFMGVGLLLFVRLTRRIAETPRNGEGAR